MRRDILQKLSQLGVDVSHDGTIRLFHATSAEAATEILSDGCLRPRVPTDPSQRQLLRGCGLVHLSTRPEIQRDLVDAQVLLAVSIYPESAPNAELRRANRGQPKRAELEIKLRAHSTLPLTFAGSMAATAHVGALPELVASAMTAFEASDVGRQLADPAERSGRCGQASGRFISALRYFGEDGRLLEWAWPGSWHRAVLLGDEVVIDWTASQFTEDEVEIAAMPYPVIDTRQRLDLHMRTDYGAPAARVVNPDDQFMREHVMSWSQAQLAMPERAIQAQRPFRG